MNAAVDSGVRRSALLLHAMQSADRDWVLAALPASQREELVALLGELGVLGIPADGEILRRFTVGVGEARSPTLPDEAIGRLATLLQDEPPQVAAWLLADGAQGCSDRLLAAFDDEFASQVEAARRLPVPRAAAEATAKLFAEHVKAQRASAPKTDARPNGALALLRRWRR